MMRSRVALAVLVLAAMASASHAAQDKGAAKKKGIVKVTVTKPDGTPAPKVLVKFFKVVQAQGQQGGAPVEGSGAAGAPSHRSAFKDVEKQVGAVTTNENGEAEIKTLLVGSYKYHAGNPVVGTASGDVAVDADNPTKLDIKLETGPTK